MKPLGLLLILMLALTACSQTFMQKIDSCKGENFCLQKLAVKEKNINVCDYSPERDACIFAYSSATGDYDDCSGATNKEQCIFNIAAAKNDSAACDQLYRMKAQCHLRTDGNV